MEALSLMQQPHLLPQLLSAMGLNLLKFSLWVYRPNLLPQLILARGIHLL